MQTVKYNLDWFLYYIGFYLTFFFVCFDVIPLSYQNRESSLQDLSPLLSFGLSSLIARDSKKASVNQLLERRMTFVFSRTVLICNCILSTSESNIWRNPTMSFHANMHIFGITFVLYVI